MAGVSKYRYVSSLGDPSLPDALCANHRYDPELWFMDAFEAEAKAVCFKCPELRPCAEWGVSNGAPRDGVIGGIEAKKRAKIRRSRSGRHS